MQSMNGLLAVAIFTNNVFIFSKATNCVDNITVTIELYIPSNPYGKWETLTDVTNDDNPKTMLDLPYFDVPYETVSTSICGSTSSNETCWEFYMQASSGNGICCNFGYNGSYSLQLNDQFVTFGKQTFD